MDPSVTLDIRQGVAHLTLNRPEARNAIDLQLAKALDDATRAVADDAGVRAVLLTGAGRTFCAGGDLSAFSAYDDLAGHLREVTSHLHPAIARLDSLGVPVVAAVRGAVAGAGLGLACASDILLASHNARFVVAYTKIGLSPDGSVSWSLPRLVGLRRALELTLTNRMLKANEAMEWGIVTAVVANDRLDEDAAALAAELASGATHALGGARRLMRTSLDHGIAEQMSREQTTLVSSADHADAREGIDAFLAKRAPQFGAGREI